MTKKEFYYPSSDAQTQLHAVEWLPEGECAGILQIAHGIGEHALRYAPFAEYMTAHGFAVCANDHLGHGKSVPEGPPTLYFGEKDGWRHVTDDLYTLRCIIAARHSALPFFLLGHSMGSFLARSCLIRYPGSYHAAILMGTGQPSPALLSAGRLLAGREAKRIGAAHCSPIIEKLSFGAYNKPFAPNRTAQDWLSVNPQNIDAFLQDSLCGQHASAGLFRDMLGGIAFNDKPKNLRQMHKNTPVLFVSGKDDPVGDMGKGVIRAYESFLSAGMRNVTLKLYPGLRHEILNETEKELVYADLLAWMQRQM